MAFWNDCVFSRDSGCDPTGLLDEYYVVGDARIGKIPACYGEEGESRAHSYSRRLLMRSENGAYVLQ